MDRRFPQGRLRPHRYRGLSPAFPPRAPHRAHRGGLRRSVRAGQRPGSEEVHPVPGAHGRRPAGDPGVVHGRGADACGARESRRHVQSGTGVHRFHGGRRHRQLHGSHPSGQRGGGSSEPRAKPSPRNVPGLRHRHPRLLPRHCGHGRGRLGGCPGPGRRRPDAGGHGGQCAGGALGG